MVRPKTPEPIIRMECGGEGSGDIISEGGWGIEREVTYDICGICIGLSYFKSQSTDRCIHAELPTNTGKNQTFVFVTFSDVDVL